MTDTVIHTVRLILPETVLENAWVRFEDGTITAIGEGSPPQAVESINGKGRFLSPGLVDIHIHGGNGSDFLDGTAEAFHTVAEYHLSRGTTALSPTLATTTYDHIRAVVDTWSAVKDKCTARLLPVHLEGPHLAVTKAGAQNPKLLRAPTSSDIGWLVENASGIAQMTIAPELPHAMELIEQGTKAGIVMSAGHTEAREDVVSAAISRGLSKVTHLFNAMTYAAKAGLFRQPGLAEYALVEDRLGCELIADGFHALPTLLKLAIQSKGPSGTALISDALAGTGLPVGSTFMLGDVPCKVAEGVCMLADGSALAGSATVLIDQVRLMNQKLNVPLADAVRMASLTPATLIHAADRYGSIAEGKAADFVQFDEAFHIDQVWVGGGRVAIASTA